MPINPELILGIKQPQFTTPDPLEQYGKTLTLQHLMQQGALGRRAMEDDDATRAAYAEAKGDPATLRALLSGRGQYKAVQAFDKVQGETELRNSTIASNKAKTAESQQDVITKATTAYRDMLSGVNDPSAAAQWVTAGYQDQVLGPVLSKLGPVESAIASIPTEQGAFQRWKQERALGAIEHIKQNKPHITTQNLGGTERVLATPGLGGAPQVLNETARTATPDAVMTDARTRAEGAANRGVTIRGQNNADSRARERLELERGQGRIPPGYRAKSDGTLEPIPGGPAADGVKLTESQAKGSVFYSQMASANEEIKSLGFDMDKLSNQLAVRAANRDSTNWLTPNKAQQYNQAAQQWAEAYLRIKTGAAATESEVKGNARTFFPQPGDSAAVIDQKNRMRTSAEADVGMVAGPGKRQVDERRAQNPRPAQAIGSRGKLGGVLTPNPDGSYNYGSQ